MVVRALSLGNPIYHLEASVDPKNAFALLPVKNRTNAYVGNRTNAYVGVVLCVICVLKSKIGKVGEN